MFNNKTILITGGSGSWGTELTKQLLEKFKPKEIRIYSRGEHKQVEMKRKFDNNPRLKFIIGDVRDKERLSMFCRGVNFIFHLAALKHVPICEENPWEAVLTNIYGTENVIEAAIANDVDKVIDVSSDKAVDPFNLYGVTKACAEKLIVAANAESVKTRFVCVRGGNVIGTAGSVVPLFRSQIIKANEITLTDGSMTRYFITLSQAISLLFRASSLSYGGEIFVLKMPGLKIMDLANVMIKSLGKVDTKITTIGIRPGEKIDEVLISKYESKRVIDKDDYYIILPMIKLKTIDDNYKNAKMKDIGEYSSKNTRQMDEKEIGKVLSNEGWLDREREMQPFIEKMSKQELLNFFTKEGWLRKK